MVSIKDPAKFLSENGLLFEINRRVLHPVGLSLEVHINYDTNQLEFSSLSDLRKDPEGVLYSKDQFDRGKSNYNKFLKNSGSNSLNSRQLSLGFIEQTMCDDVAPKFAYCVERLDYYKDYTDDWDGEGAKGPLPETLTLARNFAKWLVDNGIHVNDLFVSVFGHIEFSLSYDGLHFHVPVFHESEIDLEEIKVYIMEKDINSIYEICKDHLDYE